MNTRRRIRTVKLAALSLAASTLAVGCVDAGEGFLVIKGAPTRSSVISCDWSASASTFLGIGYLDVESAATYPLVVNVQNRLTPVASAPGFTPPPVDVSLTAATVELVASSATSSDVGDALDGSELLSGSHDVDVAGVIPSNGTLSVFVDAVDRARIVELAGIYDSVVPTPGRGEPAGFLDLAIHVSMSGSTPDGDEINSNDFQLPLKVCRGCLGEGLCPSDQVVKLVSCFPGTQYQIVTCGQP